MASPNNNSSPSKMIVEISSDMSTDCNRDDELEVVSGHVPQCISALNCEAPEKLPNDINHASNVRHSSKTARANHVDLLNVNVSIPESEAMKSLQQCNEASRTRRAIKRRGLNDAGLQRQLPKKKKVAGQKNKTSKKLMIGFGVPGAEITTFSRDIPTTAQGPPYFYFENVARARKPAWKTISKKLYGIKPEFVDSLHFCAAARKRGYLHNLPIDGRFQILPEPPSTIQEALPSTKTWWPKWDDRIKFSCIVINYGSAKDIKKIGKLLDDSGPDPPEHTKDEVLRLCRRPNFIWVGKNRVGFLGPKEREAIMGFPDNHTSGVCNTSRYKYLGNTFQVDTVAYHLSVLKKLFPNGIRVLSLFSGIGGAEVALHKLGIRLELVVSVEISEDCRRIQERWWQQSNQPGVLIHISDVKDVTHYKLKKLMKTNGLFDLVIGGSPCNNLSGNNRKTRHGLEGDKSCLFFDYCRILKSVKKITLEMKRQRLYGNV